MFGLYTGETLLDRNIQLINIHGKNKWTQNKAILDGIMNGFKKSEEHMLFLFDNDMRFEIGQPAITDNMFFIGFQDIEDSIESSCWVEILNSKYEGDLVFTEQEVDDLKSQIPNDRSIGSNGKFYKKLDSLIVSKWLEVGKDVDELERIPSKGKESTDFLMTGITGVERIPKTIKEAFDKLMES